jgi:hypothetical protein
MFRPFVRESFGHLQNATFSSRVRCYMRHCSVRGEGSDVDDFPRPTELQQSEPEFLGSHVTGLEVHGEDLWMSERRAEFSPASNIQSAWLTHEVYLRILHVLDQSAFVQAPAVQQNVRHNTGVPDLVKSFSESC